MRHARTFLIVIGLIVISVGPLRARQAAATTPSAPSPGNVSGSRAYAAPGGPLSLALRNRLRGIVDDAVKRPQIPGAIVGVWVPGHGSFVYAAGYADLSTRKPTRLGDYTRIGSLTKTFVGTMILQLVRRGSLRLDDSIERWVPYVPNARHITVREVLNMSSGIFSYTEDKAWVARAIDPATGRALRSWSPEQLVRVAIAHPPTFPPGKGFHYSNTNYLILGIILRKLTGTPIHRLMQQMVLQPLGLRRTSFPTGNHIPAPHLHGYDTVNGQQADVTVINPSWAWTAGAMISDIWDLHRWAQALGTGSPLLTPALQKQRLAWNAYALKLSHNTRPYGLGIAGSGQYIGHVGELPGYNTCVEYLTAAHATFVVMVNSAEPVGKEAPAVFLFKGLAKAVFPTVNAG